MYIDLNNMSVFAVKYEDEARVEKFLRENNIEVEYIPSSYVNFCCPECGDSDFWDGSHCNHCGYNL